MTRIRYKYDPNLGVYISQTFIVDRDTVKLLVSPTQLEFYVVNSRAETIHFGSGKSMISLKKSAKRYLKQRGVPFLDEVRKSSLIQVG